MPEKRLTAEEFEQEFTVTSGEGMLDFSDVCKLPAENVWTVIEGSRGENLYVLPGFHYLNRIGYLTTEKSWEGEDPRNLEVLWLKRSDII